ncbi:hypothetical protein V6N13_064709 [Hibiscus sabdariffa]
MHHLLGKVTITYDRYHQERCQRETSSSQHPENQTSTIQKLEKEEKQILVITQEMRAQALLRENLILKLFEDPQEGQDRRRMRQTLIKWWRVPQKKPSEP